MSTKKRKGRPGLVILCVILALFLLIAAAPFLYDAVAGFGDYDDVRALTEANREPVELQVDKDGGITLRLDKADLYSAAEAAGGEVLLRSYLSELPGKLDQRLEITKTGFRLDGDTAAAQVRLKLFGFLPLQLRAAANVELTAEDVTVTPAELNIGKWISVSPETLAERFGIPELSDGVRFELPEEVALLEPDSICLEEDGVTLHTGIARRGAEQLLSAPSGTAKALKLCAGDHAPAEVTAICSGDCSGLFSSADDMEHLCVVLTGLTAAAEEKAAEALRGSLEAADIPGLRLGDVEAVRAKYAAALEEQHILYEQTLNGLRERYKQKEFSLSKDHLRLADGQPAESLLPESWGARIVLQYNRDYEAIVRANDGVFSAGLQKWLVLPNPSIYALKRDSRASLPNVPGVEVFDLTLALRMPDGTPAMLFCMADGTVAVNTISEALYGELVSAERLPVLCASEIPMPEREDWARSKAPGPDWSDLYFMF